MHDIALGGGRGFFIWVLFRSLAHTVGWPATIGIMVVVGVGAALARQRQQRS